MKYPHKGFNLKKYPEGSITQYYGENPELYKNFGMLSHNGIDSVAPHGTPLLAVEDARVVVVKNDPGGFGKHVRLRSKKKYAGAYREWTYGHCDTIIVDEDEDVQEGQQIATMGNTGFVVSGATPFWKYNPYAGTHVHLGLRLLVPNENGWTHHGDYIKYEVKNYGNGLKGAIDPRSAFTTVPPENVQMYQQLLTIQSIINGLKNKIK